MGDVASGNDGFLSGYKFAVKFRFGGTSLLPLQVFFSKKNLIKKASRKGNDNDLYFQFTSINVTKC